MFSPGVVVSDSGSHPDMGCHQGNGWAADRRSCADCGGRWLLLAVAREPSAGGWIRSAPRSALSCRWLPARR